MRTKRQNTDPDSGTAEFDDGSAIQAIGRGVRMLSMFSEQETELSLGQLTERFGLGKSTTHRYATSLRQCGLLRYDVRSGRYSLGMRLVQLGQLAQVGLYVSQAAGPHMERLANELNETSVLSIWDGEGSVVVRVADAPRRLVYIGVRVGSRLGPDTAQYRIFEVFMDPFAAALRVDLASIVRDGCVVSTTLDDEIRAIGAPIFQGGVVVAALAVVGTPRRIPSSVDAEPARLLRSVAGEISSELGWPLHGGAKEVGSVGTR